MIHPSVTDTADVNEFGAVRIPEEILRKLGAGVGDLISFVKDGDSIRLVVKKQNSIQNVRIYSSKSQKSPVGQPYIAFALAKAFRSSNLENLGPRCGRAS